MEWFQTETQTVFRKCGEIIQKEVFRQAFHLSHTCRLDLVLIRRCRLKNRPVKSSTRSQRLKLPNQVCFLESEASTTVQPLMPVVNDDRCYWCYS